MQTEGASDSALASHPVTKDRYIAVLQADYLEVLETETHQSQCNQCNLQALFKLCIFPRRASEPGGQLQLKGEEFNRPTLNRSLE